MVASGGPSTGLPALREELDLFPGERLDDGQPSWTLHDPGRNLFFRIDWQTFETICRWQLGDSQKIAADISAATTLQISSSDVDMVVEFMADNQLLQPAKFGTARSSSEHYLKSEGGWRQWLLHHYLFFRIPLVRPDQWLSRWMILAKPFYSSTFVKLSALALCIGLIEIYRDWERFSTTLLDTFSWRGLVGYGLALGVVKVLHELGHAFTAKRYGCHVPVMGLAFLVMIPVAYTDTSEVWKLGSKRRRLAVASAGIATELIIATWATLAWALLPEGSAKSIAFMLATTTWVATLAINTSPFMRFDGYFILSDWIDMPNLHSRSFALAKWDLRERLFRFGIEPPENLDRGLHRGLVVFAYATWIYRLAIFLGIAALVYTFFIKAVGILLFLVEICWFILFPLWQELKVWQRLVSARSNLDATSSRLAMRRVYLLLAAAGVCVLAPWPTRPSASAILRPVQTFPIYAPAGAQVVNMPWTEGSKVGEGQTLIELTSPELSLRWHRGQASLERSRWLAANAGVDDTQRVNLLTTQNKEDSARTELESIQAEISRFAPKAPFSGILRDIEPELTPGLWVSNRERLGLLVNPDKWFVETYLDEDAVRSIKKGDQARFFTDGLAGPVLHLRVDSIEPDATRILANAQMIVNLGGSIVAREKNGQFVPERAVYRVILTGDNHVGVLAWQSWRGRVVIRGSWEAPALRFFRASLVLLWRELGF